MRHTETSKSAVRVQKTDVLVNNAGGVFGDRNRTIDGFEKTIQVNYLATFLLTTSLWLHVDRSRPPLPGRSTVTSVSLSG